MNRISVSGLLVSASLVVSPVAASATATSAAQAAKNAAANTEKKICKQLPSSSSRLPQRVCLTEKQWKQVDEDNR
jgi:hypothetical protein